MALEDTLFTWDVYDEGVTFGSVQFYRCCFVSDVGPFKKGDKADAIYIDVERSIMHVYRGKEETRFSLTLVVSPLEEK